MLWRADPPWPTTRGCRSAPWAERPESCRPATARPTVGRTKLGAAERNAFLLKNMEAEADRACAFVCCLVLVLDEERIFAVQETCPGELLRESRGSGGFGYDPIVFLPQLGKSVAELSVAEKNLLSHRGRACARMAVILRDIEKG